MHTRAAVFGMLLTSGARMHTAAAGDLTADPATFKAALASLQPGDTLHLSAGDYPHFSITGLAGTEAAPILITGPMSGAAAIVHADPGPCCNTIELSSSSYLTLAHLTVDGANIDGAFGLSAAGGPSHHITIEACEFKNHLGGQQTVAISTKTPVWSWTIRGNRIIGAGTGMYLGNSDGTDPFIGGVIEGNLIEDTIGYNMQIKWQLPRTAVAGMPSAPTSTVIRNNVFIKTDRASPDGDRPNVLVGGFPATGAGADDRYQIYGNLFYYNHRESLLQASGRVTVHDNIFVDTTRTAVLVADHDLPLRQAFVYNNTVYAASTGIRFGSAAPQGDVVAGNLVFADTPIGGAIVDQRDNLTDTVANAGLYVTAPSTTLAAADLYPLPGKARGEALDVTRMQADLDVGVDFNGTSRGDQTFRGAYAGEGTNLGWHLGEDIKTGGGGGGSGSGSGEPEPGGDGGCSAAGAPPLLALVSLVPVLARRRRRVSRRAAATA